VLEAGAESPTSSGRTSRHCGAGRTSTLCEYRPRQRGEQVLAFENVNQSVAEYGLTCAAELLAGRGADSRRPRRRARAACSR